MTMYLCSMWLTTFISSLHHPILFGRQLVHTEFLVFLSWFYLCRYHCLGQTQLLVGPLWFMNSRMILEKVHIVVFWISFASHLNKLTIYFVEACLFIMSFINCSIFPQFWTKFWSLSFLACRWPWTQPYYGKCWRKIGMWYAIH